MDEDLRKMFTLIDEALQKDKIAQVTDVSPTILKILEAKYIYLEKGDFEGHVFIRSKRQWQIRQRCLALANALQSGAEDLTGEIKAAGNRTPIDGED